MVTLEKYNNDVSNYRFWSYTKIFKTDEFFATNVMITAAADHVPEKSYIVLFPVCIPL